MAEEGGDAPPPEEGAEEAAAAEDGPRLGRWEVMEKLGQLPLEEDMPGMKGGLCI